MQSIQVLHGVISSYDPKSITARVLFKDRDNLVSNPYQVVLLNSSKNRAEIHLDPGEHVLCLCLGQGLETGFVLGCVYDMKNPPMVGNRDRWVLYFDDAAHIFYDREKHILQIKDSLGSYIEMKDGDVVIQSARNIHLNPGDHVPEKLIAHISAQFD